MDRATAAERITKRLAAFELAPHADRPVETLSRGQRQKVLIIAAVVHDPEVLLLDEPLNGLDANSGMALRTILESLVGRGKSILFCTHIFEIVQRLCQRVVVIAEGRIVADDATETFVKRIPGGTVEAVFRQLTKPDQADEGAREFIKALAGNDKAGPTSMKPGKG
jgi:ABC-2 type transport system ATP-binding protein